MHITSSPILAAFLLSTFVSAHFKLNYPNSLGFDDDNEPNAPCGGENIVFADSDTSVSVNGFPVALLTTHPQGSFLYRGTLDKQAPFTWTDLQSVSEVGAGNFCLQNIKVPSNWTGSSGLVQIIGNLPDGLLYQCAAVKFVSGAATTVDSSICNNGSITVSTISPAAVTASAAGTSGSMTSTASTTGSTPASTSNAASSLVGSAFTVGVGAVVLGLFGL